MEREITPSPFSICIGGAYGKPARFQKAQRLKQHPFPLPALKSRRVSGNRPSAPMDPGADYFPVSFTTPANSARPSLDVITKAKGLSTTKSILSSGGRAEVAMAMITV